VTFESDWRKAKSILMDIANKHAEHLSHSAQRKIVEASKKLMIFYRTLTPTVYTSVQDCGVLLTLRYLCKPRERRGTEQAIWEDILESFAQQRDIDFAYPTQRFYDHRLEGKTPQNVRKAPRTRTDERQSDESGLDH
jgi:small-conductance mechanosensitive channel